MRVCVCAGSVDALSLEDRRYFHPARAQWQRVPGRPSAYRLRPNSYIWVPSAQLFPRAGGFPAEFSLLATLRLHPQSTLGTVLSLRSRRQQDAYLSLEVSGDGEGMRLVHAATNGSTQLVALPGLKIQDGRWHHVAIGLHGDHTVRSYLDCRWVSTNILRRNSLDTPQDADVVIGYLFMGDLEQLTVVPSAEAVSEQCDADVALTNDTAPVAVEEYGDAADDDDDDDVDIDSTSEEGSGGGIDEDLSDADNDIDTDYQYEVEWSEWSECSASCGTGSQSRFSRCVDDGKRLELCVEAGGERTETRACSPWCPAGCGPGRCVPPGRCECPPGRAGPRCWDLQCGTGADSVVCRNGGHCGPDGSCVCADGWTGRGCATPVCEPACQHGGTCIKPRTCHCPPATSGDHCQHFWCRDACLNGGQCVGPDQCECPHNSSGPTCGTPVCDPPCENGATCQPGNTCLCDAVFTGTRCEKRKCEFRPLQEPYTRGFRRLVAGAAPADAAAGAAAAASCDPARHGADCQQPQPQARYQTLYKTFYRTVYRCADEGRQ
ncbi:protein kinase C-binding protein NELL2-like [Schistocerca piceifrons]|uniref:protein kinase C-binding protein NELL2-like n=1 Tax=Schistocerca piceifrons TaxID=274613 RepID=UPI001F5E37CF|nr:protein kinase C-binding protein NELL2-like [Schistocerca piceifrons]